MRQQSAELREVFDGFHPRAYDAYRSLLGWLIEVGVVERALVVGDTAPAFSLPDAKGTIVSSDAVLEKGPLVVSFFRGGWCPFCISELDALQRERSAFDRMSATLLAITPDQGIYPRRLAAERGYDIPILSDVRNEVGQAFGIMFSAPTFIRDILAETGVDLSVRHGVPGWMLPIPATFIIDQHRVIRAAYVEPDYTIRPDPSAILAQLERIAI